MHLLSIPWNANSWSSGNPTLLFLYSRRIFPRRKRWRHHHHPHWRNNDSQTLRVKSSDGTATTSDNDYTAINTTVTFAAGEASKTISVSTTADLDVEDDETFSLSITAEGTDDVPPQISDGSAIVTIKADDFKRGNSLYTIVDGPSWSRRKIKQNHWVATLQQSMTQVKINGCSIKAFLDGFGFTDKDKEGDWKWISGEKVTYTNWDGSNNPSNNWNAEHYAYLDGSIGT